MWQRFDIVRLRTTRNVKFLSGPAGRPADPNGNWSIVGNLPGNGMVVLAKDSTIVVVPITDIQKVAQFDVDRVIEGIKRVRTKRDIEGIIDGQEQEAAQVRKRKEESR